MAASKAKNGVPANKEPPATHKRQARGSMSQQSLYLKSLTASALASTLYVANKAMRIPDVSFDTFGGGWLRTTYIGVKGVDEFLKPFVAVFGHLIVGGEGQAALVQLIYFLPLLTTLVTIWTIESYRPGHAFSLISWPSLFGVGYQLLGIGVIGPIYYLLSTFALRNDRHVGAVPKSIQAAITPATCIGFVVPTIMMYLPSSDPGVQQFFTAFWQPVPIYCAILTGVIALIIKGISALSFREQSTEANVDEKPKDSQIIYSVYYFLFVTLGLLHVSVLSYIWFNTDMTLAHVFVDLPSPFSRWDDLDVSAQISIFIKYDLALCCLSLLIYLIHTIWEIRLQDYVSSQQAVAVTLAVLVGQVLVGPGATYAGLWYWREGILQGS